MNIEKNETNFEREVSQKDPIFDLMLCDVEKKKIKFLRTWTPPLRSSVSTGLAAYGAEGLPKGSPGRSSGTPVLGPPRMGHPSGPRLGTSPSGRRAEGTQSLGALARSSAVSTRGASAFRAVRRADRLAPLRGTVPKRARRAPRRGASAPAGHPVQGQFDPGRLWHQPTQRCLWV